jgi:endonuclease YncB( thermonuclease family)
LVAVVLLTGCAPAAATPGAVVDHVVDGDTVEVVIGGHHERVRLIGIDTPEVYVTDGPPECYGPEASAFTKRLLAPGTAVRLERDIVGRDDYGRLLAYVYLAADGRMVNQVIVDGGYAQPLTIRPNGTYAARFVAGAKAAEAAGLGLWGACGG